MMTRISKFTLGVRVKLKEGIQSLTQSKGSSGTITVPENPKNQRCIVKWDIGSEYAYPIEDLIILSTDWDE